MFKPEPEIAPFWSTLINEVALLVTLNALPVEETEAEMFESVILFVDKLAAVKIGELFNVAVPLMLKLVFTVVPPFKVTPPPKVAPLETLRPWLKVPVEPFTVNPLAKVPNPELLTVNKLVPPLFKINEFEPGWTEADIDPDAILNKLKPVIDEAGILVKPAPEPINEPVKYCALAEMADKLPEISTDPVNRAGPILIKVFEPVTVKVPITVTLPENTEEPVLLTPLLPVIVPGGPMVPWGPLGPNGPGDVTCTTFILEFVVTILLILLLLEII
jgi:hypothetical protein